MSKMEQPEHTQFLYQVSRDMSRRQDADQVLQCLAAHTQDYFESEAVSILWIDADGTQEFRAVEGPQAEKFIGLRLPKGEGISGWVAEHGETVWIPDVAEDTRFFSGVDASIGFKTLSILAAPMQRANRTIAIVELVNPPAGFDGDQAQKLIEQLMTLAVDELDRCELIEQGWRYRKVFGVFVEPSLLIALNGMLVDANRAARQGFLKEDVVPAEVHFDELSVSSVPFLDLINQLGHRDRLSWDFNLGGESARTYRATLIPISVEGTTFYHWSAYDITDFLLLEDSRLQLFNMLVHDLRVPLGSIHHSLELVTTAWQDKDITIPVDQVLEIALRSEQRMERLISDILDTTRLASQTKALTVTKIDIPALIEDAISVIATSAYRRNHSLQTKIQSGPDILEGDFDILQRVLINILENAVKYTPDGGEIHLAVYDDVQNVYFEVSDNGPGIMPADADHIFELFFRGQTSRVKGAGIGLAFSKLAVEAHGGAIWLDRTVASGAKFVFSIPKKTA